VKRSSDRTSADERDPFVIACMTIAFVMLLSLAVGLVYARITDAPFIFDDADSIERNPSIVKLWPLVGDAAHPGPLNPLHDSVMAGRPLVNLSLALNFQYGRDDPRGYHLVNIAVHVLCGSLLFLIVWRTLQLPRYRVTFDWSAAAALAAAATLLWALHPLNTETVAYVSQRTELLVALFYLSVLYCALRYWTCGPRDNRPLWLALATLACCAGMACKEVMVSAPVMVLLFERTFVVDSFRAALRKSWPLYVGLACGWIVLALLNYDMPRSGSAGANLGVSLRAWWMTQCKVLLEYLKLSVWPWPLSIHYPSIYLQTFAQAWPWVLAAGVLVITIAALLWRRSATGYVGTWAIAILSPTLLVPIVTEVAAERRMYLPLAALVMLAVTGTFVLGRKVFRSRDLASRAPLATTVALCLLLTCVLGALSVRRLAVYQDAITLWTDAAQRQPNDYVAQFNLAKNLADARRIVEALDHYHRALELRPTHAATHYNLGNLLAKMGRSSEAIEQYEQAIRIKPKYAAAHNNLGNVLRDNGQLEPAIEHFEAALRLVPYHTEACGNLALAYAQLGQVDKAKAMARRAIELAESNRQPQMAAQMRRWLADYERESGSTR
jgi:tetratricopeptide (TPR) repeat protein